MSYYFNDDVYSVSYEAYNKLCAELELLNDNYDFIQSAYSAVVDDYVATIDRLDAQAQTIASYQATAKEQRLVNTLQASYIHDLEGTNKLMGEEIVKVPRWLRRLFGATL